ncbi:hypothetical protein FGG08_002597 [Glutinoglossum americanum]|uniref:Rab-GAP TBC domain-containing protein n=1 Tax=Glutinoglossum americanum TaxID=1670608 RepID=A0A9P8I4J6_9PEZI|nr:hypothetical protein FGG08_002597 [Glutinoglossum americanum]
MSTSPPRPLRSAESYSTLAPPSPRISRTIRRLQSAHTLSSNPPHSDAPPVPPFQRWQPQNRVTSSTHKEPPPPAPSHANPTLAAQINTRSRSNSDAPVASVSTVGPLSKRNAMAKRVVAPALAGKNTTLEAMLREGPPTGDIVGGLRELRFLVLTDGVASDGDGMSSLRIYIWLILLSAPPLETDAYLTLVHRGPSPAYSKIRNDTFRTLATDPLFRRRVSEASLIRLLNAVAWKLHDAKEERNSTTGSPPRIRATNTATADGSPELHTSVSPVAKGRLGGGRTSTVTTEGSEAGGTEPGTYVQGMNVLAAPFLYAARSEAEAFVAFHRFLTRECPGYVRGAMDGVHRGLSLVDKCLTLCDPKLSAYLLSKGMHAELYAFPSVLTLCACTPPLPEVLHLWDFLFAYGAHLNVLCIVAQLCLARDAIMESPSPMKILRSFPPLQAAKVKGLAIALLRKIPESVYEELVMHAR